jgi:hypothetical protein
MSFITTTVLPFGSIPPHQGNLKENQEPVSAIINNRSLTIKEEKYFKYNVS